MALEIAPLCNKKIQCACGRTHFCPIREVVVEAGALALLPGLLKNYQRVVLVADDHTYEACGRAVDALLGSRIDNRYVYTREGRLVPDERAVSELEDALDEECDLILGVGSGVINDICKYVAWRKGMDYGIVATAPSMDGYASSGAAMIVDGMKVTYTAKPPCFILADTDIVRHAPIEMIRAGYGDIIGKYSALNDWKLSAMVTGEYFCQEIYDLVMDATEHINDMAEHIIQRDPDAVAYLTKALILIGVTLSLLGSTRPGSGSEHHLSHFFEIVGLLRNEPHFCHGIDVAYSTVITAAMRERIAAADEPVFCEEPADARRANWKRIYGKIAGEVQALQNGAGSYARNLRPVYREKWVEIRELMRECPSEKECLRMLLRAGYDPGAFEAMYGKDKIRDAALYGKDLKDRYSVLWLYYALFSGASGEPEKGAPAHG